MRSWPQLVIFDCDGVLVDSELISSRELARALTEAGVPMSAADCRATFTGWSMKSVVAHVQARSGKPLPANFLRDLRRRDRAAFESDLKAIPAIHETLAGLTTNVCVASSGTPEKIVHSLLITDLLDQLAPHLFSAQGVGRGKPAPDLFLAAARAMHSRPRDALVIEDSTAGVQAARRAGMRVFGFVGGAHANADLAGRLRRAGAERTFSDMRDLAFLIRRAGGQAPSIQSAPMLSSMRSRSNAASRS